MKPFTIMRDALRTSKIQFKYLNAAQPVTPSSGLMTDARCEVKQPALVYLYAKPTGLSASPIRFV